MVRSALLVALLALSACTQRLNVGALLDPAGAQRRGTVELAVKSAHPTILDEIEAGGGPNLSRAMDAAGVPVGDRPARVLQLRGDLGLYAANPGALVTALMLYGG